MIQLDTLVQSLEDGLNENNYGLVYKLFGDGGDYVPPTRVGNAITEYVNGIVSVTDTTRVEVYEQVVATTTAKLEIVVKLGDNETDTKEILQRIRQSLEDYLSTLQTSIMTDVNGTTYSVGVVYSLVDTGTIAQRQVIGKSITFLASIDFGFVENGVNSGRCKIYIDDVLVPYENVAFSRTTTVEKGIYAISTNSEDNINTIQQQPTASGIGVEFSFPLSDSSLGEIFTDYLVFGINEKRTLKVVIGDKEQEYKVIILQLASNFEGVKNVGYSVTLAETREL